MITSGASSAPDEAAELSVEHRLERGELLFFPICPFPLPQGDDLRFLLEQRLASGFLHLRHKNISFDPETGRVSGYRWRSSEQGQRLRGLLAGFSGVATAWLARLLPHYTRGWRLDRATLRTEEEATRPLRLTARNDLLHLDAFPTRPTQGWRILRLFANVHPTDPRVWVTSETADRLLARYGSAAGLPLTGAAGWGESLRRLFNLLQRTVRRDRPTTRFMHRLHDHLKLNDAFQEKAPKLLVLSSRIGLAGDDRWPEPAELRGRLRLEHSYFVSPQVLLLPGNHRRAARTACGAECCSERRRRHLPAPFMFAIFLSVVRRATSSLAKAWAARTLPYDQNAGRAR
jgi:hypothetical protein